MLQFLDGVHTAGLQQFSKLRTYTIDAIQIAMVSPLQNQLAADTCLFLQCLTTCWLWVPMIMQLSKEDAAAIQSARQSGRKVTPKDRVRLVPAMLKARDGKMIYSTFSNREEIPADLQKKFVWVQMQSGQCARNVVANSGIEAMVVNPNSKSLLLKRDLLEKIVKPLNESTTRNTQTSDTDDLAKEPDTTGYTS